MFLFIKPKVLLVLPRMSIEEKYNVHYREKSNSNNCNPHTTEPTQTQITLSNKPEDIIAIKRKIEV